MKKINIVFVFILAFILPQMIAAPLFKKDETQGSTVSESAARGMAEDEFRRGVQAFYRGAFNDAILQFEKALSYRPGENLILDWLGRSYYRSGIEGAALQQWQFALDSGYGGLLLQNRMEAVRVRRSDIGTDTVEQHFTQTGGFASVSEGSLLFSQPVSVLPLEDGTAWVLAYGSNELLRFDINGYIVNRVRGPLNGFDRPLDVIKLQDDNLLVSESKADRLALLNSNGGFIKYIGEKGRAKGQFIGPQYMAQDDLGNIYVTDFGNARVVVFDSTGEGLFDFGTKTEDFVGLKGPTGVAILDGTVFVADCIPGCIYMFDLSGNYKGQLVNNKTLSRPEALKVWKSYLVVADTNRVYTVDSQSGAVFENASVGNAPSRLTSAAVDVNGNVIVTDFRNDEVSIMSRMTDIIGGLFVQIEKIDASRFPSVNVEVKVENRRRQPVVGLSNINFYLSEDKHPVTNQNLIGVASKDTECDITILIDRSLDSKPYESRLEHAVSEIAQSMNGKGTLRIVSAGKIPLTEYQGTPDKAVSFNATSLKTQYTQDVALDLGIRLAGNDLINANKKRTIIFISAGTVSFEAFKQYGLADLSAFMNNNSIGFALVNLTQDTVEAEEINFLVDNTTGSHYYVYRPEGLNSIVSDILNIPNGLYQINFTSTLDSDYGKAYLPLEVETYLQTRSGRDEIGYFAPLQ